MLKLEKTLRVWRKPEFAETAKHEITQYAHQIDLRRGLRFGSYVLNDPITVVIHSDVELAQVVRIRAGVFFQSVIGGCSCADDPTSLDALNEYAEIQLDIDKGTSKNSI